MIVTYLFVLGLCLALLVSLSWASPAGKTEKVGLQGVVLDEPLCGLGDTVLLLACVFLVLRNRSRAPVHARGRNVIPLPYLQAVMAEPYPFVCEDLGRIGDAVGHVKRSLTSRS